MTVSVTPSVINGRLTAPSSKSITHRALIAAALSNGVSTINHSLLSDDTNVTLKALQTLGIGIEKKGDSVKVTGGLKRLRSPNKPLALDDSGTSLRLLTGIVTLVEGKTTLTGSDGLKKRPMLDLLNALSQQGVVSESDQGFAPLAITGKRLKGGEITIHGESSSQFISSLLLIAPFAKKDMIIHIKDLKSKPYVALTLSVMKDFGVDAEYEEDFSLIKIKAGQTYKPQTYTVEGDYSSSSYHFAAAAITGGSVTLENLRDVTTQGDRYFLKILHKMGCSVMYGKDVVTVSRKFALRGLALPMGDYPDIVQTLAVVAACAKGETIMLDIDHLRYKETDRINNTAQELKKMGIVARVGHSSLDVVGGIPSGGTITTHNDHRMAMAFTVLGLGARGKTIIRQAEVVDKSYPTFFTDLQKIGANIAIYE